MKLKYPFFSYANLDRYYCYCHFQEKCFSVDLPLKCNFTSLWSVLRKVRMDPYHWSITSKIPCSIFLRSIYNTINTIFHLKQVFICEKKIFIRCCSRDCPGSYYRLIYLSHGWGQNTNSAHFNQLFNFFHYL